MELFEFVFILSLTVLLPLVIFKSVMDFKKRKLEAERGPGTGTGVTAGELKAMLAEVVREANAPLVERIEALEPAGHRDLFVGVDDVEAGEEDEARKTLGRSLRG